MPGIQFDYHEKGINLLANRRYNKGSAFPSEERQTFGLHGLLPPNTQTLDEQVRRAYDQYNSRPNALAKNTFMTSMKEQNEVLYYRVSLLRIMLVFECQINTLCHYAILRQLLIFPLSDKN